jgi:hypothetical protein
MYLTLLPGERACTALKCTHSQKYICKYKKSHLQVQKVTFASTKKLHLQVQKNYICKYNKLAKFGEITLYKQRKSLTNSVLVLASFAYMNFDYFTSPVNSESTKIFISFACGKSRLQKLKIRTKIELKAQTDITKLFCNVILK